MPQVGIRKSCKSRQRKAVSMRNSRMQGDAFEGVFMTRTERDSPTDPGMTTFGLGVVLATPREFAGNTYDRLFYQLKQ